MMYGLAQLPKVGSTVYGPIPAQWAGTEKKGAAGPRQKKCVAAGGSWIGPQNKRWCQIPVWTPAGRAPVDLVPVEAQGPGAVVEKGVVTDGVITAGGSAGAAAAQTMLTPGGVVLTPFDDGMLPASAVAAAPAPRSAWGSALVVLAVGAGALWYFTKYRKRRRKG
jgi:hypothetical protein